MENKTIEILKNLFKSEANEAVDDGQEYFIYQFDQSDANIIIKALDQLLFTQSDKQSEEGEEQMSISSKKGTKVIYTGKNGYDSELIRANKYLTIGKIYTVDSTVTHDFSTKVFLQEILDVSFNSVHFIQPPTEDSKVDETKKWLEENGIEQGTISQYTDNSINELPLAELLNQFIQSQNK